jgi:hypothetical protein
MGKQSSAGYSGTLRENKMNKWMMTALLTITASAHAIAAYPKSQPAQASEIMVRTCQQQRTGIDKDKVISRVYNAVIDWPIASTTAVAAAIDEGWNFAVQNPGVKCDRVYLMMIDMLAGKKN